MLDDLLRETIEHLEDEFYQKKMVFSYSSLKQLMWNPAIFYQLYVLGNKEEKPESHLVQGRLVHCLLLEEENFDKMFFISPDALPSGNTRQVVDAVFKQRDDIRQSLTDYEPEILQVLKDINLHQSLKTDESRIGKIVTSETIAYWDYLKIKQGKILISQEDYDYCKGAVELIKQDKKISQLIGCGISEFDNVEILNEMALQMEVVGKPFGIKGILDNIIIDHDKKEIRINDIKTTSKDLKDFPETIEFYSYWLQAVLYCSLVAMNYSHLIDAGYDLKFHFVVIDKTFQTYAFPVSQSTLNSWLTRMEEVLKKAEWHYINKDFTLPYDFATGNVVL